MPWPLFEYPKSASTTSSLSAASPGTASPRSADQAPRSSGAPLSVAERTRSAATSTKVELPGSAHVKRTAVVDRNMPSPGPPVPSVRSRVMSYPVTSSRRARSTASTWVRLRTPATLVVSIRMSPASPPLATRGVPSLARSCERHEVAHVTVG